MSAMGLLMSIRPLGALRAGTPPDAGAAPPAQVPHETPVWAALCPEDTVTVPLSRARRVVPGLPPGTPVALVATRPFSRRALQRACAATGLRVERELVALPTAHRPLVLFDDDSRTVARFWAGIAVVPPLPGGLTALATLALTAAARAPWWWTGAVAPGRVLIGVRR